ncbi:MAG: galactose mutarotase [Clostridia bacterium]|nr:galactose mutarotase [Clostridia bacterium]
MITKELFGNMPTGEEVFAYTITNNSGASMKVLTLGGIIQQLNVPDRDGKMGDVILGYDDVNGYLIGGGNHGALIGRYGNRIAEGRFTLNGVTYQLAQNSSNNNHLHGGKVGFNEKLWDATAFEKADSVGVILTYTSADGEENYPGKLNVKVTYTLSDNNELSIRYEAVSDKDTICNLTNHSYFNLTGDASKSILDELLCIDSDAITAVDHRLITTGELMPVKGTAFDFTTPTRIGEHIDDDDQQIAFGGGFDHNYVLKTDGKLAKFAELSDNSTGRVMTCYTDQPGVQFYAGNQMKASYPMKGGVKQEPRHGICLETQHAPDSPNRPEFPTTTLKAGEKYDTTTIYAFSVR